MIRASLLFLALIGSLAQAYNFECNLYCYNGGTCQHGSGEGFGTYTGYNDDTVEALPWEADYSSSSVGMYCSCPVGFTGLQCEIALKVCVDDSMTCFNGGGCKKKRSGTGKYWWHCECDIAASVMTAHYAENYCDNMGTTICNSGSGDIGFTSGSYCKNGGKCNAKVSSTQEFVGCTCQDGYEGTHCQTVTSVPLSISEIAMAATSKTTVAIVVSVFLVIVVCATTLLYCRDKRVKKQRRRRRRLQAAGIHQEGTFVNKVEAEMT